MPLSNPDLSRKPPEAQGSGRFSKRTMVGKKGESILRGIEIVDPGPCKEIQRRPGLAAVSGWDCPLPSPARGLVVAHVAQNARSRLTQTLVPTRSVRAKKQRVTSVMERHTQRQTKTCSPVAVSVDPYPTLGCQGDLAVWQVIKRNVRPGQSWVVRVFAGSLSAA